jgi:N-acetylneuraminic acid mutarotase
MNTLGKSLTVVAITLMLLSTLRFSSVAAEGDVWTPKSPMLTARAGLGVVAVNGKIYAIGGMNNNSYLNVNEEYDPVTDKWTTKTPMPTARSGFAIATYKNKIYVFGGTIGDSTTNSSGFTGITQVYTPGTDTWTTKTSMPTPRADLSASVVNGKIYLIGGKKYVEHDPYYEESNINEVYDPGTDSWMNKTSIPTATFGYASAVLDNKIYIIGGGIQFWERWDFTFVKANQIYDAENDDWTVGATFDPSLSYMAAAATSGIDAFKRIYVVGGFFSDGYSNATHVYNPKNSLWSIVSGMPTPRIYLNLVVLNDVLYAIGGYAEDSWLRNNEMYVPSEYGTVPPELRILKPESKLYRDVELVFTVNKPTEWIGYSIDGQTNVTVYGNITLQSLPQGSHRVIVYANDSRGNVGSSISPFFSVDVKPPNISILSPENKTYDSTDIKSVFTVDEQVVSMNYSLDGNKEVSITGNVTLPVLSEGSHKITFYAEDTVGNEGSSDTVYFNIQLFPTTLVIAAVATIVIVSAGGYLFFKRRGIRPRKQQA